jgi:gluconolactonase
LSVFAQTKGRPAGMAFDREGNLFVCQAPRQILKITPAGDVSLFADRVGDLRLIVPNFPVFDADGNLYVSNSTNVDIVGQPDLRNQEIEEGRPNGALVRFRPDGRSDIVATGLYFANGTAIDPSEEAVYVLQSSRSNTVRIPINGGGGPEVEPFGENLGGVPDGMAFDASGNLIVTLVFIHRLVVLDRDGKLSTLLDDPTGKRMDLPTNCAFGGPEFDDLYIASLRSDHIPKLHIGVPGHPLYNLR